MTLITFVGKFYGVSKPRDLRLGVAGYFTLEQDFLAAIHLLDGRFLLENWTPAKHSYCSRSTTAFGLSLT